MSALEQSDTTVRSNGAPPDQAGRIAVHNPATGEVIGHVDLLINAGHVREVNEDGVVRYETTAETPAGELGDLIPGGNPAAEGS